MQEEEDLREHLRRIEGRGYGAYKDLRGEYRFRDHALAIDHVQGDPFAAPSRLRIRVPMEAAAWPSDLYRSRARHLALADFLTRRVQRNIEDGRGPREESASGPRPRGRHDRRGGRGSTGRGSGKSGLIQIDVGGQEVLERSALQLGEGFVEARIEVGLPAAGRRVLARQAESLLCETLPELAERALFSDPRSVEEARRFVESIENQESIRAQLCDRGLIAFVANGAILPRRSGASQEPLARDKARPFQSPAAFEVEFELPNAWQGSEETRLRGMGIPEGVSLIVGGGYHGKSTLLRALERGVYPHVPGDGREGVVSDPALVKIRAEDGRRVERVDIQPFIRELPRFGEGSQAPSTRHFSSDDASGSTSQAANIIEALEAGARGLLLDEDTSATNFMLRDARMQALVHSDCEPITPFVDRVRELFERFGVSTVLVMGGCGDYFEAADHVIMMRDFAAEDAGGAARDVALRLVSERKSESLAPFEEATPRIPVASSFDASRGRRDVKIDAKEVDALVYGRERIDLRGIEQLVDRSQTRAIGYAVWLASGEWMDGTRSLGEVLDEIEAFMDEEGLDGLTPRRRRGEHPGRLARPRRFEIAAAINRLRTLEVRS